MKENKITSFKNEYAFLSNFYVKTFSFCDIMWPSVEHAFQAAKTADFLMQEHIQTANTPKEAKRRGRNIKLRDDWEQVKNQIMANILHAKFRDPDLRNRLIRTNPKELIEGNYWHDNYWGICTCYKCHLQKRKLNVLGRLLMKERNFLMGISKSASGNKTEFKVITDILYGVRFLG